MSQHHISIGPEFFAKARNDYANWTWALAREFLQNSIDCGSTKIDVHVELFRGNTVVTVENNGEPMTRDILVDKLLCLGGSGKDFQGTVGGFGKAKELLYFCHQNYTIQTGDLEVQGAGAQYTIEKRRMFHGTKSIITLAGDLTEELTRAFGNFIDLCQVTPRFFLNGAERTKDLPKGFRRREMSFGVVYTNRQYMNLVVARVHGIPMFLHYTGFKGCVVLELNGSQVLTSNRDGLRMDERRELDGFLNTLITDKKKALNPKQTTYQRFEGPEIVCAGEGQTSFTKAAAAPLGTSAMTGDVATRLGTVIENQLGTRFVIKSEGDYVPSKFMPNSPEFSPYAKRLAGEWTRLMVAIHSAFNQSGQFTVGFLFGEDVAQYERNSEDGTLYLINPLKGKTQRFGKKSNRNLLIMAALHEFIHGLGYSGHDEDFAAALTHKTAELMGHMKLLKQCFAKEPKETKGTTVAPKQKGVYFGHSITAIIRWMGKEGWGFDRAFYTLGKMGADVAETTIRIQLRAGQKGERGKPADLTTEQINELNSYLN